MFCRNSCHGWIIANVATCASPQIWMDFEGDFLKSRRSLPPESGNSNREIRQIHKGKELANQSFTRWVNRSSSPTRSAFAFRVFRFRLLFPGSKSWFRKSLVSKADAPGSLAQLPNRRRLLSLRRQLGKTSSVQSIHGQFGGGLVKAALRLGSKSPIDRPESCRAPSRVPVASVTG